MPVDVDLVLSHSGFKGSGAGLLVPESFFVPQPESLQENCLRTTLVNY